MADSQAIASALHAAIESGDTGPLGDLYADDAVIWHNSDYVELTKDASLASIGILSQIAEDVRVEVVRFAETDFGFVEQIVLRGTVKANGNAIALHNCILVTVDDGRVTRIDEYVDPNGASQFA